jgi:uncharacterized protein (TIGR02001 family)
MNSTLSTSCAAVSAFFLLLGTGEAHAESSAEPALTAATNVNLLSQYRFRGIDQTWGRPAVQGGVDVSLPQGFYAGLWASNISGNSYPGGNLELDYHAGYNGKLGDDVTFTVGGYGYWYPGANYDQAACPSAAYAAPCALPSQDMNTFEVNGGVTWRWFSYKLSVSATDYFGANTSTGYSRNTRGTLYHDLTATWPVTGSLSLTGHVGRTDVHGSYGTINPDYTDWRVALAQTFEGGWNASIAAIGASNDTMYGPPTGGLSAANGDTRELNRPVFVLQVGRVF